jgi:glucokinase
MSVLVGDIGGTNCRLAIARRDADGAYHLDGLKRYAVRDHAGIEACISDYLSGLDEKPDTVGLAAAGPKFDGAIRMTNISWLMDEDALKTRFGFSRALVINDFVGMATGATVMPADAFTSLVHGEIDWAQPVTVMGPGTGMGISIVAPGRNVIGTEGGHVSFAPETDREAAMLQILWRELDYVSWETLVSGPGLMRIYKALCDIKGENAVISDAPSLTQAAGLSGTPREAVMVFCGMLGAYAGNAALIHGARGGVIIAGGVARHVAPYFGESDFAKRFRGRGNGAWFVEHVPVKHMHAHSVALYGVASLLT